MKKVISCLILCAMLLVIVPVSVSAEVTADTSWYDDAPAGTTEFVLDSANEIAGLDVIMTRTSNASNFSGKTVKLAAGIYDISGYAWTGTGDFDGILDGQGATVKGLTTSGQGMFKTSSGTIKDLYLDGVSVSGTVQGVGALVGNADSGTLNIDNVHVTNASVSSTKNSVGGFVGLRAAAVQLNVANSSYTGSVEGVEGIGGIVGQANGNDFSSGSTTKPQTTTIDIDNCAVFSYGIGGTSAKEVGGIVGYLVRAACNVRNSCVYQVTEDGAIKSGNANDAYAVGGIIGKINITKRYTSTAVCISSCYVKANVGDSTAKGNAGGIVGRFMRGGGINGAVGTLTIEDCLFEGSTYSKSDSGNIIGYYNGQANASTGASLTLTLTRVVANVVECPSNASEVVYIGAGHTSGTFVNISQVYTNKGTTGGTGITADKATVEGAATLGASLSEVSLTGWASRGEGKAPIPAVLSSTTYAGYQTKANSTLTYDYRLVATLTLPAGKTLGDIEEVGIFVTLTNGTTTVSQKISCSTVYKSVEGGGITYRTGTGENVEGSIEYVGGEYIFVVIITGAPASLTATLTTYMTVNESQDAQSIVFGAAQRATLAPQNS